MPDIDYFVQMAFVSNPLREPILHSAIQTLQFPLGSRGLDAGCGIGLQALLLAKTVGPVGHITGLDLSPEVLVYAHSLFWCSNGRPILYHIANSLLTN